METNFTEEMLRSMEPCPSALRIVLPLLPTQISTEPEANLDLVFRLITRYNTTVSCNSPECTLCFRRLPEDLQWLIWKVTGSEDLDPEARSLHNRAFDQESDNPSPKFVSEFIAFIARHLIAADQPTEAQT